MFQPFLSECTLVIKIGVGGDDNITKHVHLFHSFLRDIFLISLLGTISIVIHTILIEGAYFNWNTTFFYNWYPFYGFSESFMIHHIDYPHHEILHLSTYFSYFQHAQGLHHLSHRQLQNRFGSSRFGSSSGLI